MAATWTEVGSWPSAVEGNISDVVALNDGRIAVNLHLHNGWRTLIFDPVTGDWAQVKSSGSTGYQVALGPDGRIYGAVVGLYDDPVGEDLMVEAYDPVTWAYEEVFRLAGVDGNLDPDFHLELSPSITSEGRMFIPSYEGTLLILELESREMTWSAPPPAQYAGAYEGRYTASVTDGRHIYLTSMKGIDVPILRYDPASDSWSEFATGIALGTQSNVDGAVIDNEGHYMVPLSYSSQIARWDPELAGWTSMDGPAFMGETWVYLAYGGDGSLYAFGDNGKAARLDSLGR